VTVAVSIAARETIGLAKTPSADIAESRLQRDGAHVLGVDARPLDFERARLLAPNAGEFPGQRDVAIAERHEEMRRGFRRAGEIGLEAVEPHREFGRDALAVIGEVGAKRADLEFDASVGAGVG